MFESQGRFVGGGCGAAATADVAGVHVSIAGAILWGVLLTTKPHSPIQAYVSIAGAILWGVLPPHSPRCIAAPGVSIAGAILWGVLHPLLEVNHDRCIVSIAGAILWGVLHILLPPELIAIVCFNRRGDSLGGAAGAAHLSAAPGASVSIAGAILWGVLPKTQSING